MTEQLFYQSTEISHFNARVISCKKREDDPGQYNVILDKTAFFPERGGQYADRGYLRSGDGRVLSVSNVSMADGIITHILTEPVPEGETVEGFVDEADRFDKMQQHTGEHIISGLIHKHFGFNNVGFHLGPDHTTMDYSGYLSEEDIHFVVEKANEAVWKNIPVQDGLYKSLFRCKHGYKPHP